MSTTLRNQSQYPNSIPDVTHNDYIYYICVCTARKPINTLIVCLSRFELGNVNEQIELKLIDASFVSITKQMFGLENLYSSNRKTFDLLCLTYVVGLTFPIYGRLSPKGKFPFQLQCKLSNYKTQTELGLYLTCRKCSGKRSQL